MSPREKELQHVKKEKKERYERFRKRMESKLDESASEVDITIEQRSN